MWVADSIECAPFSKAHYFDGSSSRTPQASRHIYLRLKGPSWITSSLPTRRKGEPFELSETILKHGSNLGGQKVNMSVWEESGGVFLPKVAKGSNLLPLKQLARAMHLSKNGSTKSGAYWVPEPNLTILSEVCPASRSELITSCNRPNRMTRLVPRCRAGSNTQVHEHPAKRGQATTPRMHSSHYPYSRCPELAGIRKPRGKLPQTIPTQKIMQKRLFRNGKAVHE